MFVRIPVTLVTGFLGSGKTTLLKHVLEHGLDRRRVAVVVNDVADLGVDGRVVSTLAEVESMVELDSGCICCSIDFRFEYALQEIAEVLRPEIVLIESTGLADPRILLDKIPKTCLSLDAVVTVVDAENVERAVQISNAAVGQIEEADFLVINKTDLISGSALAAVSDRLTRLNSRALQVQSLFGAVDTPILFGQGVRQSRQGDRQHEGPGDHLVADGFESFVCVAEGYLDRNRFEWFIRRLPASVYRAKGILWFATESSPSLFNLTCGRYQSEWLAATPSLPGANGAGARAAFIGRNVAALQQDIFEGFTACVVSDP